MPSNIYIFFFGLGPKAKRVIALLANVIKWFLSIKLLYLEYVGKICCSATFSLPTRWCVLGTVLHYISE